MEDHHHHHHVGASIGRQWSLLRSTLCMTMTLCMTIGWPLYKSHHHFHQHCHHYYHCTNWQAHHHAHNFTITHDQHHRHHDRQRGVWCELLADLILYLENWFPKLLPPSHFGINIIIIIISIIIIIIIIAKVFQNSAPPRWCCISFVPKLYLIFILCNSCQVSYYIEIEIQVLLEALWLWWPWQALTRIKISPSHYSLSIPGYFLHI